jgi:cation transport protein ChaC
MWDPAMKFAEIRHAHCSGFQRSFCLWDDGSRGSPEQPGLMLAIDIGGTCEGLAFRIEAEKLDHETFILFRRELIASVYRPTWLKLKTALGPIEALGFAADRSHERIVPDIPLDEQAKMIAGASGMLGTNFDYLSDTQAHLGLLEIVDPYVADLHTRAKALRSSD